MFRTPLKNKCFWTAIRNSCSGYKYSISAMKIAACCPAIASPLLNFTLKTGKTSAASVAESVASY